MNILGMGPLEILIVFLIAFVVLGPERMVDAGRWLGRAVAELRRVSVGLPDVVLDDEPNGPDEKTEGRRVEQAGEAQASDDGEASARSDAVGPVAFQPSPVDPRAKEADSPSEERT